MFLQVSACRSKDSFECFVPCDCFFFVSKWFSFFVWFTKKYCNEIFHLRLHKTFLCTWTSQVHFVCTLTQADGYKGIIEKQHHFNWTTEFCVGRMFTRVVLPNLTLNPVFCVDFQPCDLSVLSIVYHPITFIILINNKTFTWVLEFFVAFVNML